MAKLLSGIVNVSVLPRGEGDVCLFPPECYREVFSRDIYTGGGKVVDELIALGRWAGGTLVVSPLAAYTRMASSRGTYTADQPAGWHALYIDDPIRGVIPTPIITAIRWKSFPPTLPNGLPNPYHEDLDPVKVKDVDRFKLVGGISMVDPKTSLETYYGIVGISEKTEKDGKVICTPILLETGYIDEGSWRGLSGNYFQFVATPTEVYSLCAKGKEYSYEELYNMAFTNTTAIKEEAEPPFTFTIEKSDYIYEIPIGNEIVKSYYKVTIPYVMSLSPRIGFRDYSFGFVLGLTSPLNQLFALYSNVSCFRLFWGNHYMLEFIPAPGGGITYFYFFPFGYVLNSISPYEERIPVDPEALTAASVVSGLELQRTFRLTYYDPAPNPEFSTYGPYVFVTKVEGMEGVWSNMRFTAGESVEGYLIMHLKGHVCIFRWDDIVKGREGDATVKPIFSFNPYEYVKRNFSGQERENLLHYFSLWTCPPDTQVGFVAYNLTGRISFFDLCYLPMTVVTRPFLFSPRHDIVENLLQQENKREILGLLPPTVSFYLFSENDILDANIQDLGGTLMSKQSTLPIYRFMGTGGKTIPPIELSDLGIYYGLPYVIPSVLDDLVVNDTPYIPPPDTEGGGESESGEGEKESGKEEGGEETAVSYGVFYYLSRDPGTGVYFPLTGNQGSEVYEALCGVFWTLPFPLKSVNERIESPVFNPPPLELGLSPTLFPTVEDYYRYVELLIRSLGGEPLVTWDVTVYGRRFLPRPPLVLGLEVGRMGVLLCADHRKWISLSALANEIGWGSIIQAVSVNLTGRLGENTASIVLSIPWIYSDTSYPIELPPILRDILVPYNHILVELGYLLDDGTYHLWGVFEGVIRSVSANISESDLGLRRLMVTVECNDIGVKLRQATVTEAAILDGWRVDDVIVYATFASGINPERHVLAFKGFPLGYMTALLASQDSILPPEKESLLFYKDYTFINLVDYPRYVTRRGTSRFEVVETSTSLSGMEIMCLPSPLDYGNAVDFLDRLILPRIGGWELVGDAYELGYVPSGRGMVIQTVPTGFYELVPSWDFSIQKIIAEGELPSQILEGLLSVPVFLPSQPYVRGIMSFRWDYSQWLLPTYVSVLGRRISGQPFIVVFHDIFNEILQPNSPLFRGFRIGDISEVPAAFTGIQAILHALKRYLATGYTPPLRASMRIVGLPFILPRQKIALDTPVFGVMEWVVGSVTLSWRAGQLPETQLDLIVPHPFAIGIIGG